MQWGINTMLLYRTIEFDTSSQLQKLGEIGIFSAAVINRTGYQNAIDISFGDKPELFACLGFIGKRGDPYVVTGKSRTSSLILLDRDLYVSAIHFEQ